MEIIIRILAAVLFLGFASEAYAECGNLCDRDWWKIATPAEVQAELDAGADVMAQSEQGDFLLHWREIK
jgi:hypothetical protein